MNEPSPLTPAEIAALNELVMNATLAEKDTIKWMALQGQSVFNPYVRSIINQ